MTNTHNYTRRSAVNNRTNRLLVDMIVSSFNAQEIYELERNWDNLFSNILQTGLSIEEKARLTQMRKDKQNVQSDNNSNIKAG